jgi:hypothetical protein
MIAYDIETYPNFFCAVFYDGATWTRATIDNIRQVLLNLNRMEYVELLGFNNIAFDYPVLHWIIEHAGCTSWDVYNYAMKLVNGERVYINRPYFHQIDLFKINHFDNMAKATSLKGIEFALRMDSIEDLPVDPSVYLNEQQKQQVMAYCEHDVLATWKFAQECREAIEFRRGLGRRWMNYSNTKIGEQWMIGALHKAGIATDRQSPTAVLDLGKILLPYITFDTDEFKRVHNIFKSRVVTETKGALTGVQAVVDDFEYVFGLGGIHGSRQGVFKTDENSIIYDWDVASFYPNLAIVNKFYPKHLGVEYCDIYRDIYEERKKHKKGTPLNAALKEALNATYGNSNNKYSPFYDPYYTMSTTINGQLLLCMLSEALLDVGCRMIQINTDGLTVECPRAAQPDMIAACRAWEKLTGLLLESVEYSKMYVRDVNNYIAVASSGKVKRKGAYEYVRDWSRNHSMLIVPKAAEAHILHGTPVATFIRNHTDPYDFMLRTKIKRSDRLFHGDQPVQRVTRYYVSTNGKPLVKVLPAKGIIGHFKRKRGKESETWDDRMYNGELHTQNKSTWQDSRIEVVAGRLTTIANKFNGILDNVDYDYYIERANKLIEVFTHDADNDS